MLKIDEKAGQVQCANEERLGVKYLQIGSSPLLGKTAYVSGGGPAHETGYEVNGGEGGPLWIPLASRVLHVFDWLNNHDAAVCTDASISGPFSWIDENTLLYTKVPEPPKQESPSRHASEPAVFAYGSATGQSRLLLPSASMPLPSPNRQWLAYHRAEGDFAVAPWPQREPARVFKALPGADTGDQWVWSTQSDALVSLNSHFSGQPNDRASLTLWNPETGTAALLAKLDPTQFTSAHVPAILTEGFNLTGLCRWTLLSLDENRVLVLLAKGLRELPLRSDNPYVTQGEARILSIDRHNGKVKVVASWTEPEEFQIRDVSVEDAPVVYEG